MDLPDGQREWLETSPAGSFALGCVDRRLRRKYHGLLTVREPGRGDGHAWSVLAELHEHLAYGERSALLCEVVHAPGGPRERATLIGFGTEPATTHRYRALGLTIARTVRLGAPDQLEVRYVVRGADGPVTLALEPLLRCRDVHALTFENPFLDGAIYTGEGAFYIRPYPGMPGVVFHVLGAAAQAVRDGRWMHDVVYPWELARGYDGCEHLFSPGRFVVTLSGDASFTLIVALEEATIPREGWSSVAAANGAERTPAAKLARAARAYLARTRAGGTTVVAGYPWLTPRGRDALIALPGLYLATGDFAQAAAVLEGLLAESVDGLIADQPARSHAQRLPSVDASLLFVRTVQWFHDFVGADLVARFMPAVCALLEALADGQVAGVRLDAGLGVWSDPGPHRLTWMDALVDGVPVTPRAGYVIERDALAYNAAHFATAWARAHRGRFARAFRTRFATAEADFVRRYWDDTRGYLADGHDGERPDPTLRPNQLYALGLPQRPVAGSIARAALAAVTRTLLVPAGLRTLAVHEPGYCGVYGGDQRARDLSYHQGTVWPFLLGIYADAVYALHGRSALEARLSATLTFLARHLDAGCIGQVSELFAGDAPHAAGGAPAYAASAAELVRTLALLGGPNRDA